jgi:hypothetical protein
MKKIVLIILILVFILILLIVFGWPNFKPKIQTHKNPEANEEKLEQLVTQKMAIKTVENLKENEIQEQKLKYEKVFKENTKRAYKCLRNAIVLNEMRSHEELIKDSVKLQEKILSTCVSQDHEWDLETFYLNYYPELYDEVMRNDPEDKMVNGMRSAAENLLQMQDYLHLFKQTVFTLVERMWAMKPSSGVDIKLKISISEDLLKECTPNTKYNFDLMMQKIDKLAEVRSKILHRQEWTEKQKAKLEIAIREELLKQQEIFYREINPLIDECRK